MKEKITEIEKISTTTSIGSKELAFFYWQKALLTKGWAIDATCGNGKDTARIISLLSEEQGLIGIDIEKKALLHTEEKLASFSTSIPYFLFLQNHATFPSLAYKHPISLIVYNLGYLPGGGDKTLTTYTKTTIESLQAALSLIIPGGMITISCYSGHLEGELEEKACLSFCRSLCKKSWVSSHHQWVNRNKAPSLLVIQRQYI